MIRAHARIADDLLAIFVDSLVAPIRVVVVGAYEVKDLLHHGCRAATLGRRSKHSEVETMLVVDFLLDGEEVTVGLVEGAFRIARQGGIQVVLKLGVKVAIVMDSRITPAGIGHNVPAVPQLACADGGHGAVVVGTIAESVAERNLLAILRGTG